MDEKKQRVFWHISEEGKEMRNRRCAKINRVRNSRPFYDRNVPWCCVLGSGNNSITVHGLGTALRSPHSCGGRGGSLHRRLLAHRLPGCGVLAAQPPIQGPFHLRAQRQFTQVLSLLGARHESLLLETLALETVETHLPLLYLGHARIAVRERSIGVDGAVGDGERWSTAVGGEAG